MIDNPQPLATQPHLVFLDFDGTIADQTVVPDSVREAVKEAQALGHLIFLNTGRSWREVPESAKTLGFDGFVTAAGAFAQIGDVSAQPASAPVVHEETIPPDLVAPNIEALRRQGAHFFVDYLDQMYATPGILRLIDDLHAAGVYPVGSDGEMLKEISPQGVSRIVFTTNESAFARIKANLDHGLTIHPGILPGAGVTSGEISSATTTKAACFPALVERLGIPVSRMIAIGDATNDVEMLEAAGVGIAMGLSNADALEAADEVTSCSIADGVPDALARRGLISARGQAR